MAKNDTPTKAQETTKAVRSNPNEKKPGNSEKKTIKLAGGFVREDN